MYNRCMNPSAIAFIVFILATVSLLLMSPRLAVASLIAEVESKVNIQVSSEGNSSTSVESNMESNQTTTTTTTTSNSSSDVTVEQNGEVKHFSGENVNYTSPDGSIQVNINNGGHQTTENTPYPKQNSEEEEEIDVEEALEAAKEEITHLEEANKDVLGESDTDIHGGFTQEFINPSGFFIDILTSVSSPLTPVKQMVSLLKSAANLF